MTLALTRGSGQHVLLSTAKCQEKNSFALGIKNENITQLLYL